MTPHRRRAATPTFAIGLDYGTNSVRALVVDLQGGSEIATAVHDYASGDHGILLDDKDPDLARQNPADYVQGYVQAVRAALRLARRHRGFAPDRIVGIGVDTTGSTPLPVDEHGRPLAAQRRFRRVLAAQAWLWKDHTAAAEAAAITARAARSTAGYLRRCGGTYSSEWYWSKLLRCRRQAPDVFAATAGWVELADFVPGFLCGRSAPKVLPRGICAAGHKAMYADEWGGLPSRAFLRGLDAELPRFVDQFAGPALCADQRAGELTLEMANAVGLPAGIPVAVGALDAHLGAVGAGVRPGTMVKILGTSSCDITVWPANRRLGDIEGLCGIVPGSVLPGSHGLEAGQSAVGDIFHWFAHHFGGERDVEAAHRRLTAQAAAIAPGQSGLCALDWNNGNRSVLVDPLLTGLLVGQTLHTTAAEVYRALLEATAFGARAIVDRFEEHGVRIRAIVACGGIAERNPLALQILADVLDRPLGLARSAQSCALGAAICGAVVGGAFRSIPAAQARLTGTKSTVFRPRRAAVAVYRELFLVYRRLHDAFGTAQRDNDLHGVMKRLIAVRNRERRGAP